MKNYHTHSTFSDGKDCPETIIQKAIEKGITHLGFSDHAPLPFENDFAIPEVQLLEYVKQIRALQQQFKDEIAITLGLEADFIPSYSTNFNTLRELGKLDYVIGGVHIVEKNKNRWFIDGPDRSIFDQGLEAFFGNDIKQAVKSFFRQTNEMIQQEKFEVIAHFDKICMHNQNRFFSNSDHWFLKLVYETVELLKAKDIIVEINVRGIYKGRSEETFPSRSIWPLLLEKKIPIMLASDAHKSTDLGLLFPEITEKLKASGFSETVFLENGCWNYQEL